MDDKRRTGYAIQKSGRQSTTNIKLISGKGGIPIARAGNRLYIDDSDVNNLFLGITRSGKGEIYVVPSVDIYSRAEIKPSLIMTDPKLELAPMTMPKLIERGYECHVLNLIDPEYSMGFNPLEAIKQEYKAGSVSTAQLLTGSLCYSIFCPKEETGSEKYFQDTSTALLSAGILSNVADNINEDFKKYEKDRFFADINGIDPDTIKPDFEYEKTINMISVINALSVMNSKYVNENETEFDRYMNERPEGDAARLLYNIVGAAGDKQKGNAISSMLSGLRVFMYENIAKMTAKSTLNLEDIGFGSKPIAVFIALPVHDRSNAFLATAFIKQVIATNMRLAHYAPGQRTYRDIVFNLDEFGNIPPVSDISDYVTTGLGMGIKFNFYLQSYSQLYDLYGEHESRVIEGNCGNQIFIMTSDTSTAEEFSKKLGNETIVSNNRTGKKLSMAKEYTEMYDGRALLDENELMTLKPGETVVYRSMKRTDRSGNAVRPYPIRNLGEHRMKFRYEYLTDDFPSGRILYDSPNMRRVYEMTKKAHAAERAAGIMTDPPKDPQVLKDIDIEMTKDIDLSSYTWSVSGYLNWQKIREKLAKDELHEMSIMEIIDIFAHIVGLSKGEFRRKIDSGEMRIMDLEWNALRAIKKENNQTIRKSGYRVLDLIKQGNDRKPFEEPVIDIVQTTIDIPDDHDRS